MSLIALGSAKASPGVTTAAVLLAAAWPVEGDGEGPGELPLVVEADPDGGVLAARYGLAPEPGLVSAAAAARRGIEPGEVRDHVQEVPGPIRVLAGPASADQAHAALAAGGNHLARALGALDSPVLVDCGRLRPGSPALALAEAAALVVLVARPRLDEVHHVLHRVRSLEDTCHVALVLVGERPYPPDEVAAAVGVPVLGVLADDPSTAGALREGRGSPRSLRRSILARSAVEVAAAVRLAASGRPEAPPPGRPPGGEELPAPAPVPVAAVDQ